MEHFALTKYQTSTDVVPVQDVPDLASILTGQLAASSIAMYKRDVQAYVDYASQQQRAWLDAQTLVAWRDVLSLQSAMSPHTINRMMAAVKRLVREMATRHMLDDAAALQFDRVRGVQVKALKTRLKQHSRTRITPDDMRRICEAPDRSTYVGMRDATLLATLASSGIRAAEVASLTFDQVVKRGNGYMLLVCGKTDTEYREAHLSPEAYRLIMQWRYTRPIDSPYVFTSFTTRAVKPIAAPVSEVTVWNIVTRYAKQCGVSHVKPHDFRRFVGTQLAAQDIRKAQRALGHKSIEVTARHYVLDELEVGLTDHLY